MSVNPTTSYVLTYDIVCSHRMFSASYRIRHRRPLHTMSYAYIVCSRHNIVCDIAYNVAYEVSFVKLCGPNCLRARFGTALSKPVYLLPCTTRILGLGPRRSGQRHLASAGRGDSGAACRSQARFSTCTAPPHAYSVTIHFYHFKGSVAHRPPLVHPDCPLELICTSTVPLRGHATAVCVGSEAAETLSSSPLHG
jgi:hypothetical protein